MTRRVYTLVVVMMTTLAWTCGCFSPRKDLVPKDINVYEERVALPYRQAFRNMVVGMRDRDHTFDSQLYEGDQPFGEVNMYFPVYAGRVWAATFTFYPKGEAECRVRMEMRATTDFKRSRSDMMGLIRGEGQPR